AIDGVAAAFAGSARPMVVAGRSQKIIPKLGERAGRVVNDKRRGVGVSLVPKMAALNHVSGTTPPKVTPAMGHKDLPPFVVVEPPLITSALGEHLEFMTYRMISPHT